jgi:hypothetical protein
MRTANYFIIAIFATGLMAGFFSTRAGDTDKPKWTIKQIMTQAHKKGLYKKVLDGNGSDDDKKELAELYVDLGKNTPRKGTPESWKEKTDAVAMAAKDVAAGKPDATAALKKANNCAACHKLHK